MTPAPTLAVAGDASAATCLTDRRTLEVAVEAYIAMNGESHPPTEADLVGMFLREESSVFDLDAAGAVIAAPGSPCTA